MIPAPREQTRHLRIVEERKKLGEMVSVAYALEILVGQTATAMVMGNNVLDATGQPHYLSRSNYDLFLGKVNSVLHFFTQKGIPFDVQLEAPSIDPRFFIVPVSRYLQ